MKNLGANQSDGSFLPDTPSAEDIFKQITGGNGGWAALNGPPSVEGGDAKNPLHDLKRDYAQFAASIIGQNIIEDLLNRSLRRSAHHPDPYKSTIEQEALYNRERKGENQMVCHILKMIVDGRNLPEPKSIAKKPAKKK